jgi:hypothetical protein
MRQRAMPLRLFLAAHYTSMRFMLRDEEMKIRDEHAPVCYNICQNIL